MEPRPPSGSLDADPTLTGRLPVGAGGPLAPGHLLGGRYRVDTLIGAGGMGQVYRARDVALEREVALKVLAGPETADGRERFLREARSAAALNHPHIVAVHDLGEDDGRLFLVMELVPGGSLRDTPPPSVTAARQVARQVALALAHAHGHGLVHRDVKPANILVQSGGEEPVVKLADLGLAVSSGGGRLTAEGAIVGTVAYLAPEQALGRAVDGRADLYSLGVLLYEMVTGRLPFEGNPIALISQHLHAPVVPPRSHRPDLDPALDALILRLLAKEPAQRFASAAEVVEALGTSGPGRPSGVREAAPLGMLDALVRGRLVGREAELEQLRDLWHRAARGDGQLALISGEAGAGKTRLASELAVYARLGGALVLSGGCYEYEAATPYLPFVEALRRWVHDAAGFELSGALGDKAAVLARLAPEIDTRLGPVPPAQALAAHEERLRLFDHVARWLRAVAAGKPVLLLLDDLQWADQGTLQLLHYVLRNLRGDALFVLATCREEEVGADHPLSAAVDALLRERLATRLHLRRLDRVGTAAVLAALTGQVAVSDELADAVHRETEGNPFFIEETMKTLVEQGVIYRRDGEWFRDEAAEIQLPEGVRSVIARRIERLPAPSRDVLHTAAALGKIFRFDELLAVSEVGEDALLDALDEARGSQLLAELAEERFAFTHDKIREVLYADLSPIRRRRMHRQLGERLLAYLASAAEGRPETLAHHFHLGGDHERALEWGRRAAEQAERMYAHGEALAYYEQARDAARALGHAAEEAAVEEAMAHAHERAGDHGAAAACLERAFALTTEPATRRRLRVEMAAHYVQIGDPRGRGHLEAALPSLDRQQHPRELAMALGALGRYDHLDGQHRRAAARLEEAWAIAEPRGDARLEDLIIGWLAGAYQHLALYRESDAWAQRCVDRGRERQSLQLEAVGLEFLAENATLCQPRECLSLTARELEIGERTQAGARMAWASFARGWALANLGRLADARATLEQADAWAKRVGERRLQPLIDVTRVVCLLDLGEEAAARELAALALQRAEALGLFHMQSEARRAAMEIELRHGDPARALALAEECVALWSGKDARLGFLLVGPLHAEALRRLGRPEEARGILERHLALAVEAGAHVAEVIGLRARAALRLDAGDLEGARADLERGLRLATEQGLDIERARLLLDRSVLAGRERRDGAADRAAARSLAEASGAIPLVALASAPILKL